MSNKTEKTEYAESFRIHSYEVDSTNKATLQAICQYLQEAASNHAEKLGFGMSWLLENQRTWMLSRLKVSMNHYPRAGEEILVRTWPSGIEGLLVLRDFRIERPGGEIIGGAVSSWVFFNLDTRRPVPPKLELSAFHRDVEDRALPVNPVKIKPPGRAERKTAFQVRYNDLDMNNHVNNIKYIEWILESLEPDFRRRHVPSDLEVNFLAEALYGHEVAVHLENHPEKFLHNLTSGSQDICRAETVWRALE